TNGAFSWGTFSTKQLWTTGFDTAGQVKVAEVGNTFSSGLTASTGTWQFIGSTLSGGSTVTVYLGKASASGTLTGTNTGTGSIAIGADENGGIQCSANKNFNGLVDEV